MDGTSYLVTGSSGLIGSAFVDLLVTRHAGAYGMVVCRLDKMKSYLINRDCAVERLEMAEAECARDPRAAVLLGLRTARTGDSTTAGFVDANQWR